MIKHTKKQLEQWTKNAKKKTPIRNFFETIPYFPYMIFNYYPKLTWEKFKSLDEGDRALVVLGMLALLLLIIGTSSYFIADLPSCRHCMKFGRK